eukprot:CAMPEP_0197504588 /NCGR_PEP_ID=MMETSP1312-20131121/3614_1 /TAXON_ID=464262 /ORGANISM="Genus nov. species nov., Strain RCC2335" /LENGTH=41 /DNA_ID= /DNA_START= /DNA_END= /DNA_ORIENTATION=
MAFWSLPEAISAWAAASSAAESASATLLPASSLPESPSLEG